MSLIITNAPPMPIQGEVLPADLSTTTQESCREAAERIAGKIQASADRIKEAELSAKQAQSMKTGFFGRTESRLRKTNEALIQTNAAISEQNELIREAIKFTSASVDVAKNMNRALAFVMANGFKDASGNVKTLSSEASKAFQIIIEEANDFAQQQQDIQDKHEKIQNNLNVYASHLRVVSQEFKRYREQKDILDQEQSDLIQVLLQTRRIDKVHKIVISAFLAISLILSGALVLLITQAPS